MKVLSSIPPQAVPGSHFRSLVEREVRSWYDIFYRWSRGLCERDERHARIIYDRLAPDFRVLLTNGEMMNKAEYWDRLLSLYAERRNDKPSRIANLALHPIGADHMLVTFDLFKDGVAKKKFDSAVLRSAPDLPGRVSWLYVHESAHELTAPPDFH